MNAVTVVRRLVLVLTVVLFCQAARSSHAAWPWQCSNGGGTATTCVTVPSGCSAATPQGTTCDNSGWTSWCACDRNWSGSVWFCGCDWII